MISIGVADISPVLKTRSDGYFRTAVIERFLGARRSRLFGRDAPQMVATVCRALSVVSIEGDWPGHSRKASFRLLCGAEGGSQFRSSTHDRSQRGGRSFRPCYADIGPEINSRHDFPAGPGR